jgi:hypothetical protein
VNFDACRLRTDEREDLLAQQDECTISWMNDAGWPVSVVQTYVWARGAFWVTAFQDKPRVDRLRADQRAAVAVSSKGTSVGPERMASARVIATVHDDESTASWFYPAFAARLTPDEKARDQFAGMLGKQDRVVIELRPVSWTTFDGVRLRTRRS